MGVRLDLTAATTQILDAVIFMENSPALSAFKEEIEKIISDFNETKYFGESAEIDVKLLTGKSSETLSNMQRSFLIWTLNDECGKSHVKESQYYTYLKLFFKRQEELLTALNGGKKSINVNEISSLKQRFIKEINSSPALRDSLKEFFAGYVYGYFFNFLSEQTIMREYAEFLVCLGVMSHDIKAPDALRRKVLPKMAVLLNNDRMKYVSGEVPFQVILNVVNNRLYKKNLSLEENKALLNALEDFLKKNYDYNEPDDLIAINAAEAATVRFASDYVSAVSFASDLNKSTSDGIRTFLDGAQNGASDYNAKATARIVSDKCRENYDNYFTSGREAINETGLQADCKGYKYPLVFLDEGTFCFSGIFKILLFPACDRSIYTGVKEEDLPLKMFPFAASAFKSNIIRDLGGIESSGYSIREDKRNLLVSLNALPSSKNLSEKDKRMIALEKLMRIVSGNVDAETYEELIDEHIFGTELYDDYIRYRMEQIFDKGMKTLEDKKELLEQLNKIKIY
ncbi:MAG: hypothetical protein FWG90_14075 [Oscillospiraceae bacterium]|nr:hypothetical protein [Oscillospiraceae bacterium]